MKSLIFFYESIAEWEAAPVSYLLSTAGKVDTFGLTNETVKGFCSLRLTPEYTIDQIKVDDYDVLIIPGGYSDKYKGEEKLFELIRKFNDSGKILGAICGGPAALFWAGVLEGKKFTTSHSEGEIEGFDFTNYIDDYAVTDGNIITAKGEGFTEFAVNVGDALNLFKKEDRNQFIGWFRHP